MTARLKRHVPWQAKLAAKIALSRLPVKYRAWARFHIFRHGDMDLPEYALRVFKTHFDRVEFPQKQSGSFVMMELGPGDSLFSALIGYCFGSTAVYLVDVGNFARYDLDCYRALIRLLRQSGMKTCRLEECSSVPEMLSVCSAQYLTEGLKSLREIPTASVDLVWSHGVLQSIRRSEFYSTLAELRRIQRLNGVGSHSIELRDCLSGDLNHLRFREEVWESELFASAGFYSNRLRRGELLRLFERAGFQADELEVRRWRRLPTPRSRMAAPFRHMSEEELNISSMEVLLR
jgi:hypothetical protein